MWYIHTMEHYSATGNNEMLVNTTTCIHLENICEAEEIRHKRLHIGLFLLYDSPVDQSVETESKLVVARDQGVVKWGVTPNGFGGFGCFWCVMKMFQTWRVMMVTQLCEYTQTN